MKLPRKWLSEFVDMTGISDAEFTERMMWRGFEMASVDPELPDQEGVIVGRVEEIFRHEKSDHLWITRTNVGSETLTIVVPVVFPYTFCGKEKSIQGKPSSWKP